MSARRALRAMVAALFAVLLLGACAPDPHGALDPLRGPNDEGVAEVGSSEAIRSDEEPVTLDDLPDDHYGEVPPGFGDVALDEMDLPPDDLPPPIEAGGAPPANNPAPPANNPAPSPNAPSPGANPAPNTPIPAGGASGVAAATDYCGLFQEYGTVMGAVDSALDSGSAQQISSAIQLAAQVHDRAAELDSSVAADHRAVASGMRALDALLASYGHDIGRLVGAIDSDPSVAARFEAAQVDSQLDRTVQHVENRCGVTMV